jgi:hypothetical protein
MQQKKQRQQQQRRQQQASSVVATAAAAMLGRSRVLLVMTHWLSWNGYFGEVGSCPFDW